MRTQSEPVFRELRKRGLLWLHTGRTTPPRHVVGLAQVASDLRVDDKPARAAIDARLQELEDIARRDGVAVGLALPYPVTLERLEAWIATLEGKGIVLAPISAAVGAPGS